jgi:cellobiose phosphorylase
MADDSPQQWQFIDDVGSFRLIEPQRTNYLYFPLVNESGVVSSVTPILHGDMKTGQNSFLLLPVSVEDLHNSRAARNFWVNIAGHGPWSATGNSSAQSAHRFDATPSETATLEAGFLWHKITRVDSTLGIKAEITSLVPHDTAQVELMRVCITNVGRAPLTIEPMGAIPIFGRSADHLRDHRHVTSLLNRIQRHPHGVLVRPTLTFDERGHLQNTITYAVLGAEGDGSAPAGIHSVAEDFIGEGGSYDWPQAVASPATDEKASTERDVDGREAMGGLRFRRATLAGGESRTYILALAVIPDNTLSPDALLERYGSEAKFEKWLESTTKYWNEKVSAIQVTTGDARFDAWVKWVSLQPILRRLCGNSFMPYHDYGRSGRGWRDLWQDILALLLLERGDVGELLYGSFAGVRLDGSNATIIGVKPGEFIADRNNIPRVWMDHGAWPFLTTRLYIDQSGDVGFLLRQQTYFKDRLVHRAMQADEEWNPAQGTMQRTAAGDVYQGSILEHLLLQHLSAFFHVGEHNIILLEGADWNDGLDMARRRGESVAFSALYAGNLLELARLARLLEAKGERSVPVAEELLLLLDTISGPVDYDSPESKRVRLGEYCDRTRHSVTGSSVPVPLKDLANDLERKADWLAGHLRAQEWISDGSGRSWFNGYYDDLGNRVEGTFPKGVRMTLTGQVFPVMAGIATDDQIDSILAAADFYLHEKRMGGYRLNTDFHEIMMNLGRCFGFAFGHKENGAMFTHMTVMFANALYQRGRAKEGSRILRDLYTHCQDFSLSKMYPGLPEYVDPRGRGAYAFLTGSASWYLLTLVTEAFGVQGAQGDLVLAPKLTADQFDSAGCARIQTRFADRMIEVRYANPDRLDFGAYGLTGCQVDGKPFGKSASGLSVRIPRAVITALPEDHVLRITVALGPKAC